MEQTQAKKLGALAFAAIAGLLLCFTLGACGGSSGSIVGTWSSSDGKEVLIFEDDKTCSVPFTYSASWWESCDRYTLQDDGTLVLSSSQGNISSKTYKKTTDKSEAEGSGSYYYLSGGDLVINKTTYSRS